MRGADLAGGDAAARELHDSVGQILAALSMNLAVVQSQAHKLDALAARAVMENAQLLQQASDEIRTISYLLHPPLLEISGLASALQWYVEGFSERSKIRVNLEIPSDFGRLHSDTELVIFRIVQECLTNIHRHSGSGSVEVHLTRTASSVVLSVQDHGKGIPSETLARFQRDGTNVGVGLAGMRERVKELGGSFVIESGPQGTLVW